MHLAFDKIELFMNCLDYSLIPKLVMGCTLCHGVDIVLGWSDLGDSCVESSQYILGSDSICSQEALHFTLMQGTWDTLPVKCELESEGR